MARVIILGGGLTGLAAGYKLSREHEVTVLEKNKVLGGLAASFEINGKAIPICYHHIMRADKVTQALIRDVGLEDDFYWTKVKMGFLHNNKIYKLASPLDLLFFKPLSFISRIKFGIFGIRVLFTKNWKKLHSTTAREWIVQNTNKEIYNTIFEPLLKTKFGKDANRISASWVGLRLAMRESSGDFGYIKGGLSKLIDKLAEKIVQNNGIIKTNALVTEILVENNKVNGVIYEENGSEKQIEADVVISTIPMPEFLRLIELPEEYKRRLENIRYKATISAVIGLNEKLSEYYWLNFLDSNFCAGGVFDHSNLNVDMARKSILYVFTYLDPGDSLWKKSDEEIIKIYLDELSTIFPGLKEKLEWAKVFKLRYSKPVYEVDYPKYKPEHKTPIQGLYLAGIGLIYPKIRNMGAAIESGFKAAENIIER